MVVGLGYTNWALWTTPVDTSPIAAGGVSAPTLATADYDAEALAPLPPLGDLSETTARPVFMASRRPSEPKAETASEVEAVAAGPIAPPEHLQLMGVVRLGKGREKALIRSSADVPGHWIPVGEMIDGWQIREIAVDKAVIETKGQRYELRMAYAGASGSTKQTGQ
jgi:hypothetical protein